MNKKLSSPKQFTLDLYRNCKKRSKKQHGLPLEPPENGELPADEQLVLFALQNCSQTSHDEQTSFYMTNRAIWNMCCKLCPGPWCDRCHCKHYSGQSAYHCKAGKKPSSCKEYKLYAERKTQKGKNKNKLNHE